MSNIKVKSKLLNQNQVHIKGIEWGAVYLAQSQFQLLNLWMKSWHVAIQIKSFEECIHIALLIKLNLTNIYLQQYAKNGLFKVGIKDSLSTVVSVYLPLLAFLSGSGRRSCRKWFGFLVTLLDRRFFLKYLQYPILEYIYLSTHIWLHAYRIQLNLFSWFVFVGRGCG